MRTYHCEKDMRAFFREGADLFKENNEELDFFNKTISLNISLYDKLDSMGLLRLYSVREEGEMVGYSIFLIQPSLHYKDHLQASQDTIFIRKDRRGNGIPFILWCEAQLKEMGVVCVLRSVTKLKDWSLILKRLNYNEVETVYMKDLRD